MQASTTLSPHLSSLVHHGSTLAALLHVAKGSTPGTDGSSRRSSRSKNESESLHKRVEEVVCQLLNELDQAEGLFVKESMDKLGRKVEGVLQKFIELDPGHETYYQKLGSSVKSFWSQRNPSDFVAASLSSPPLVPSQDDQASTSNHLLKDFEFAAKFGELNPTEKKCLYCFSLFPESAKIKKRVFLCGSFDYLMDEKLLVKFMEEGFLEPIVKYKFEAPKSYRMPACVRSKVIEEAMKIHTWSLKNIAMLKEGSSFPVYPDGEKVKAEELYQIEWLFNYSEHALNTTRLVSLSEMGYLENLELGTIGYQRHQGGDHINIVAEDTGFLKCLSSRSLFNLSLRGISGITELPAAVCKLEMLLTLDLRACHNLEYLPKEIRKLEQLQLLDLSDCYLLDHIPKAVGSLYYLQVLKGFVINPDPDPNAGYLGKTSSSSCAFSDLSKLPVLRKLTIRTRRMNFPTRQDIQTLYRCRNINDLSVSWVGSISSGGDAEGHNVDCYWQQQYFPKGKLVLQAVPNKLAAARLVCLFRQASKLCIRGGQLEDLDLKDLGISFFYDVVSLRYLPKLQLHWIDFLSLCPKLSGLEIYECPKLTNVPCDENGVWIKPDQSPPTH